jgi:hypothetical protein
LLASRQQTFSYSIITQEKSSIKAELAIGEDANSSKGVREIEGQRIVGFPFLVQF